MQKGDYKKKKSAESTLLEGNPTANVQDEDRSNFNSSVLNSPSKINDEIVNNEGTKFTEKDAEAFFEERKAAKLYDLSGKAYYDASVELYSKYQDGVADKDNIYYNTIAVFTPRKTRPSGKPDFVSKTRDGKVSSEYWYTDKGVIRGSNHWGRDVASCDWYLDGELGRVANRQGNKEYGFCKWEDFLYMGWAINNISALEWQLDENGNIKYDKKYNNKNNTNCPIVIVRSKIDGTYCLGK